MATCRDLVALITLVSDVAWEWSGESGVHSMASSGLQRGKCGWQQGIVVLLGLVCMASSAEAQSIDTPALEIAVGYQNQHGQDLSGGWGRNLHGLVVSAGRPVNDRLSLVGEVGIARFRDSDVYYGAEGQLVTYVGGVRFGSRRPRVAWFVHALVGAIQGNLQEQSRVSPDEPFRFHGPPFTDRLGVIQLGVGADIRLATRVAARITAETLTGFDSMGAGLVGGRVTAGIVVGIGRR